MEQTGSGARANELFKTARWLAKSDISIPSLEWEKEAYRIKLEARRAYAEHGITHEQMTEIIKMLEEAEE